MSATPRRVAADSLPAFARAAVGSAMAAQALLLSVLSNGYGYHRDELYFRMLRPAWGYVDQPPLTPLIAHGLAQLVDAPWFLRLPATLMAAVAVPVAALITREVGGSRGAQALCAWGFAFASIPLISGHLLVTATVDLPVWPAVTLFAMRAVLREEPRWWLAAGLVAGLSTYNKLLVPLLLVSLAAGVLLVGPRRLFRSAWLWAGMALALVLALPNLLYQVTNGWPQLDMGRALAANNAGEVRVLMWPLLLVILGPPLLPIWWSGWMRLFHAPQLRPVRFVAAAFPVLLVLVFVMGSQFYYPAGLLAVLFAVGCVPAYEWMHRHRGWVVGAVAVNSAFSAVVGLPVIPLASLGSTPIPAINQPAQDTVGWPAYVRQVARVVDTLGPAERDRAVVITSNYGEAGAVARFGGRYHLPAVYSGQNDLYHQRRPPDSADVVVLVGAQLDQVRGLFAGCVVAGRLDNEVDVDNEEQGLPIAICRDPIDRWTRIWPRFRHLD